jgi:hypothetical protein
MTRIEYRELMVGMLLGLGAVACGSRDAALTWDGSESSGTPPRLPTEAQPSPVQAAGPEPASEVVCQEDEVRCNGAALEICDQNRRSFRVRETCQSACDCYVGIRPEFSGCASQQTCTPGEVMCDGDRLLVCRLTGGCENEFVLLRQCRHAIACAVGIASGTCLE